MVFLRIGKLENSGSLLMAFHNDKRFEYRNAMSCWIIYVAALLIEE